MRDLVAIDSHRLAKAAGMEHIDLYPIAYVSPQVVKIIEERERERH